MRIFLRSQLAFELKIQHFNLKYTVDSYGHVSQNVMTCMARKEIKC